MTVLTQNKQTLSILLFCLFPIIFGFWGSRNQDISLLIGLILVIVLIGLFFAQFIYFFGDMETVEAGNTSIVVDWLMGLGLLLAEINMFVAGIWDETWHIQFGIPFGDDFFWRPHLLLYIAFGLLILMGIAVWFFIFFRMRGSLRQRFRAVPLLGLCMIIAQFLLIVLPLDPFWHVLYGRDISVWSIPHILLFYVMMAVVFLNFAALERFINRLKSTKLEALSFVLRLMLLIIFAFIAYFQMIAFTPWEPQRQAVWLLPLIGGFIALGLFFLGRAVLNRGLWGFLAAFIALAIRLALYFAFSGDFAVPLWQGLAILAPCLLLSILEPFMGSKQNPLGLALATGLISFLLLPFYAYVFNIQWAMTDILLILLIFPLGYYLQAILKSMLVFYRGMAGLDMELSPLSSRQLWIFAATLALNLILMLIFIGTAELPV
jgi:hypothetical protein